MLNWGILGLGTIAHTFCNALRLSRTGRAYAVASRDQQRARAFAATFSIPVAHPTYEALLGDPAVDAVYVATVNPGHLPWVLRAADAGKHILVEKPMGMNAREVSEMVARARRNDVFLMEAFMYRCHPQMRRLAELIRDGAVGEVRVIRAVFGYRATVDPTSRIFSRDLGGGAIMDVGCYTVSAARFVAGAVAGRSFAEPLAVKASGFVGATGVDHHASAILAFENGIIAQLATAITCHLPWEITVFGTDGFVTLPNPWLPSTPSRAASGVLPRRTSFPRSEIHLYGPRGRKVIRVKADRDLYTYEADAVAEYIGARQSPAVSWADSEGNTRVLDEWRSQLGVRFPQDG